MELDENEDWGSTQVKQQESNETRRERFVRIGKSRMHRLLNTYRLIGNLATPNYQYYEKDILAMQKAIREEHERCFEKFRKTPKAKKAEVDFDFSMRQ
jgi:hypothetical protein